MIEYFIKAGTVFAGIAGVIAVIGAAVSTYVLFFVDNRPKKKGK